MKRKALPRNRIARDAQIRERCFAENVIQENEITESHSLKGYRNIGDT